MNWERNIDQLLRAGGRLIGSKWPEYKTAVYTVLFVLVAGRIALALLRWWLRPKSKNNRK